MEQCGIGHIRGSPTSLKQKQSFADTFTRRKDVVD